jgi:hypothetical protein
VTVSLYESESDLELTGLFISRRAVQPYALKHIFIAESNKNMFGENKCKNENEVYNQL